ncbi:MAG: molybdopterin cofactor-binding domain-containing protein [Saprospiraceae bacterium]
MENINKVNRRNFLKLSALSSGGLVLGFNWSSCNSPQDVTPIKVMPKEWFDINAFLKIGDNGMVTIFSPNPEIGQNIKTSMPMIIAEELDVKWEDVMVEQAGLNTEWYSRQVAGGSQSIRHGWDSLRMAGATAKRMLVNAAAKQWEIDPTECTVSDGMISNGKGETLGFGEVAKMASTMEVPNEEEVKLKETKDYKIIGTPKGNVDMENIITGKPLFGIDTKRDGMMYAAVLRAPAFGQKLVSVDDTEALKVTGVQKVIKMQLPQRQQFKGENVMLDKIAVVANSTWAAMKGKKALKAVWENATPGENTTNHKVALNKLTETKSKTPVRLDGDPDKAFAQADEIIERTYESPFLPHNCLEPMNFFANVTADKVELVGPIQTPAWTRGRVAGLLNMIEEHDPADKDAAKAATDKAFAKIDLQMTRMGGGFGRRLYGDFALEAAQVSKEMKKPIQVIWSREDDMTAGTYRPAVHYKIRAAIKDKKITGYHLIEAAVNGNMWASLAAGFPASGITNYQCDNHTIESNVSTGAWRAPYTNFLASAEQSFLDEVAQKTGQDAVQMRLDILAKAKEVYDAHTKLEDEIKDEEKLAEAKKGLMPKGNYEPDRFIAAIKMAAEKGGWGNAPSGTHLGFSAFFSHNTYVAQVAQVKIVDKVPKVEKVICVVDCGIVVNPLAATNLIQGGVIDGIGHSMFGDFSFENGTPSMNNFNSYRLIRMNEAPLIEVHYVDNGKSPTGLGEPTLPPAGAAIANAFHSATGVRMYNQPYVKENKVLG